MKDVLLYAFVLGFFFACAVEHSSKLTPSHELRMRQGEEKRCGS